MRNIIMLFISLTVTVCSCHKNNSPHYKLNSGLQANFGYNIGSYWIYRDSINGEIDSYYVSSSKLSTDYENDATVDRMDIGIKKFQNNTLDSEVWMLLLIDSTLQIQFQNTNDLIQAQLEMNLFNYPIASKLMLIYGIDSGYVTYGSSFKVSGVTYDSSFTSIHNNYYNIYSNIRYNDAFFISQDVGFFKVIFNHPQDSIHRVLELEKYKIVK